MIRPPFRFLPCILLPLLMGVLQGAAPPPVEFPGFRTVETAITSLPVKGPAGTTAPRPGYLGIQLGVTAGKPTVSEIDPDSPAAGADLRVGDILVRIAGETVAGPDDLRRVVAAKGAGAVVDLEAVREGKTFVARVELAGVSRPLPADEGAGKGRGFDNRRMRAWSKSVYRLAVVLIDYPDSKTNPAIKPKDWEDSLFSKGTYTDKSATGQKVLRQHERLLPGAVLRQLPRRGQGVRLGRGEQEPRRLRQAGASRFAAADRGARHAPGPRRQGRAEGLRRRLLPLRRRARAVARGGLYWPHRATRPPQGQGAGRTSSAPRAGRR